MREWRRKGGVAVARADMSSYVAKKKKRTEKPIEEKRKNFEYSIRRNFGLSVEDFARMAHSQGIMCAICEAHLHLDRMTHIDHCHATGRVRALLCHNCNVLIGMAKDEPRILAAAIEYLESQQEND